MKEVASLLNLMLDKGIIMNYAFFGAVAQMRYTEAVATLDADILVATDDRSDIISLRPIYSFCDSMGYKPEGEAIRVGDWPVQFIPVFDELTSEALSSAEDAKLDDTAVRVVKADYLALIALSVGRSKDHLRILSLLQSNACTLNDIDVLARKHGLHDRWLKFQERFLNER